jgi:hypothetical protein
MIADEAVIAEATLHGVANEMVRRITGTPCPVGVSIAVVLVDVLEADSGNPTIVIVAHGNNDALNDRLTTALEADLAKRG